MLPQGGKALSKHLYQQLANCCACSFHSLTVLGKNEHVCIDTGVYMVEAISVSSGAYWCGGECVLCHVNQFLMR